MKILLSCVNSPYSLVGYDLLQREIFRSIESTQFKACGASFFGESLLIASDDYVLNFSPKGTKELRIEGPYKPLLHSIHPVNEESFGVVDTGHSALRIYGADLEQKTVISPLQGWPQVPEDAIHLNDFVVTQAGIFASCFGYRPWREIKDAETFEDWCSGGYGLLLNLTGYHGKGRGKVVMHDLCQPHSLTLFGGKLYCCSSGIGVLHELALNPRGTLIETRRSEISNQHFIRGLLFYDEKIIIGGSTRRHGQKLSESIALYTIQRDNLSLTECCELGLDGEIYDILLWDERMDALATQIKGFQL